MKPRAKKFRIRRTGAQAEDASEAPVATAPAQMAQAAPDEPARQLNEMEQLARGVQDDGFGPGKFATAQATHNVDSPEEVAAEDEIAAIRKEGLTGRQLRMARRVAQKHGFPATSDFDAVRLLRRAGVDPFQRATMLELVSAEGQPTGKEPPKLPQTVDKPDLPSTKVMDAKERAKSIMDIQLDIARRRRRKLMMLMVRLAFFVMLPTLIAGYYYFRVATPMYATKSEFVIEKADAAVAGGLGSLFSGSGLATSQDSITVQSYLNSREAMVRLDQDVGFKTHFENPSIDPVQRLPAGSSNEKAYRLYKKMVKIGYDPSEGIIKMQVTAADPQVSAQFSEALLRYAEERVDNLTARKREDQMKGARESYEEAERKMLAAQKEVERLQQELGVLDATSESSAIMSQVNGYEIQLLDKQLQLQQLLDNQNPNQARVDGVRGDIARLTDLIAQLRSKLTNGEAGNASLAEISGKLQVARTNLETRILLMQQALEQLETARIEANKQTRYLSLGVSPVPPDEPTYPQALENTILAFLIFSAIYLMLSLTASILREQVSA